MADASKGNQVKLADRICRFSSIGIVLVMAALAVLRLTPAAGGIPPWLSAGSFVCRYILPVLASAAVGYLTNAIAIWMLFRPYEKHWFWPQGVIPRQKKRFGHELGVLIPRHLLKPEKISSKIGKVVLDYLRDPLFVPKVRVLVNKVLTEHKAQIAAELAPYVEELTEKTLRDVVTKENFSRFSAFVAQNVLEAPESRQKTVRGIVAVVKDLLPEFSGEFRKTVAARIAETFRREHPYISFFKDKLTDKSVEDEIDDLWSKGEAELLESLQKPETQERIAGFLAKALRMCRDWTERPENAPKIEEFLADRRKTAETYVSTYLAEKLPVLADELLSRDSFWKLVEEKVLPVLQLLVVKVLRGEGNGLLAKFDVPGEIEKAVNGMKVPELHKFVIQASNDNLTLLQVLGFFLGAAAGAVMAFAI